MYMNFDEVTFRNAEIEDIDDIMKIENSSFARGIAEDESAFIERIKRFSDGFIVMEYEGDVIGYFCSEIWNYNDKINKKHFMLGHAIEDMHHADGEELYISSMGLLPKFRGNGLGKLMFDKSLNIVLKKYNRLKSVILIVSENWIGARKIYNSNSFNEILVIKDFFNNNSYERFEDGIIMRKKFI